jgi:hypothetical protein
VHCRALLKGVADQGLESSPENITTLRIVRSFPLCIELLARKVRLTYAYMTPHQARTPAWSNCRLAHVPTL